MLGIRFRKKRELGNIRFSKILDEILDELMIVEEKEIQKRARELEKEYSEKTGFEIRIESSGCLVTLEVVKRYIEEQKGR